MFIENKLPTLWKLGRKEIIVLHFLQSVEILLKALSGQRNQRGITGNMGNNIGRTWLPDTERGRGGGATASLYYEATQHRCTYTDATHGKKKKKKKKGKARALRVFAGKSASGAARKYRMGDATMCEQPRFEKSQYSVVAAKSHLGHKAKEGSSCCIIVEKSDQTFLSNTTYIPILFALA